MSLRGELLRRIENKRSEVSALEIKVREARVYISALEDTLKIFPSKDKDPDDVTVPPVNLRGGSLIAKARETIRKAGKPLHISEILAAVGKPNDKDHRAALSGSIASYVRRGDIFTRPAPNTFGLIELPGSNEWPSGPPPNFGTDIADDTYGAGISGENVSSQR